MDIYAIKIPRFLGRPLGKTLWQHASCVCVCVCVQGGALPYVGGYQVPVNRPPF